MGTVTKASPEIRRCPWVTNEVMRAYHDTEWGVPLHDDRRHFEFIILDGAQAGLSWNTILQRREGYRKAFAAFDPVKVARFTPARIEKLLQNPGIIRNRLKVAGAVTNARCFLKVQEEFGAFDRYIWRFTDGRVIQNRWNGEGPLPATSPESDAMSRDLRSRGFTFVGSVICYAYMQAAGMVNDHALHCFRHREVRLLK